MYWIMSSSILACIMVEGACFVEPPHRTSQPLIVPDWEVIDQEMLASGRQFLSFLKEEIAWQSAVAADFKEIHSSLKDGLTKEQSDQIQEAIDSIQKLIDDNREHLRQHERYQRGLERYIEQKNRNPSLVRQMVELERLELLAQELWGPPPIAPPPREVKK